jgi:hypothetical protein
MPARINGIALPSDEVVVRLATLAPHVEELLMADNPDDMTPVGLRSAKNDRRRTMESMLVLLADPGGA